MRQKRQAETTPASHSSTSSQPSPPLPKPPLSSPKGERRGTKTQAEQALRRYQEGLARAVESYYSKGALSLRDEALVEEFCSFIAQGAREHCQRPERVSAFGRAAAKQFLPGAEEGVAQ